MSLPSRVNHVEYDQYSNNPAAIAEELTNSIDKDNTDFAFLFASTSINLDELTDEVDKRLDCNWTGCTTAGEISESKKAEDSCVLITNHTSKIDFTTGVAENIRKDPVNKSAELAERIGGEDTVFVPLLPGFTEEEPAIEFQVLKGIFDQYNAETPVVGAAAGDNNEYQESYQFCNGEVYSDALVLTGVETSQEYRIELGHGYDKTEHTFLARSEENVVTKLNGRPAQEVYAEQLDVEPEELEGTVELPSGVEIPKVMAEHSHRSPFGVKMGDNYALKVPQAVDDGAIVFNSSISNNSELVLMEGSKEDIADSTANHIQDIASSSDDIIMALVFECAGRAMTLGDELEKELEALQNNLNGSFAGFFSYGEIGGTSEDFCTSNFLTVTSLIITEN
ncbi:MAG: hypothetical protein ACI977_000349 [Candidatus Nanohaloarchaea archaeon]|jgi:hypothetical protein